MSTVTPLDLTNSTIVRINKSITYRAIRSSFELLERYAPSWGTRWAEFLWFRTPAQKAARDPAWLPVGEQFRLPLAGTEIHARRWGQGPIIYLVHGWSGHSGQLAMFVPALIESGFSVVAFDAPSHGRSGSSAMGRRRATILDFRNSLQAVVNACGPAYAILAHSLGGNATAAALQTGLKAQRLVFIAPMADPRRYLRGFVQMLGGGDEIFARLSTRIEQRVGLPITALNILTQDHSAAPPLLVFHDREDREIPWSDGAGIVRAWREARLVSTSKLGHRRILASPKLIREAVRFLAEPLPPGELASTPVVATPPSQRQRHAVLALLTALGLALAHAAGSPPALAASTARATASASPGVSALALLPAPALNPGAEPSPLEDESASRQERQQQLRSNRELRQRLRHLTPPVQISPGGM